MSSSSREMGSKTQRDSMRRHSTACDGTKKRAPSAALSESNALLNEETEGARTRSPAPQDAKSRVNQPKRNLDLPLLKLGPEGRI